MLSGELPFWSASDRALRKLILHSTFELPSSTDRSPEARDFVRGLLTREPTERLRVDSALDHAWLEAERPSRVGSE